MTPGHIYIIHASIARPPKDKIVLCICAQRNLFFWINTNPRTHGVGQFALSEQDHRSLSRDCFLDLSRMTTFLPVDLDAAQPRGPISQQLAEQICSYLEQRPPKTLSAAQVSIAVQALSQI